MASADLGTTLWPVTAGLTKPATVGPVTAETRNRPTLGIVYWDALVLVKAACASSAARNRAYRAGSTTPIPGGAAAAPSATTLAAGLAGRAVPHPLKQASFDAKL